MNRVTLAAPMVAFLCALTAPALAGGPEEKLGEAYASASPAERLVLISVGSTDRVLDHKETAAAVAQVTEAEVGKGKDAKERLELLGKLRKDAEEKLKEVNKARKAENKSFAAFREPDSYFQQALALAYISDAAGAQPTLEQLGCLALVRECTNWSAHHQLILAAASEAFARDAEFAKADLAGKLSLIKKHSEDRAMLSDQERTYIEKGVLTEWLSSQLKAGKRPAELLGEVGLLKERKQICFFTSSWAEGILKQLAGLPAAAEEPAPANEGQGG